MEHNPLSSMRRPEPGKREQVIDMAEFVKILRFSKDKCFRDLLTFSWDTGSRPQESKGLQVDQVGFDKHRCVLHCLDSKGKRVSRVIYMTPRAERIVQRNLSAKSSYVFLNTRGEPWTANAVRTRFRRLESKLGKRYTQYAFRHTFATRKLKAGVSPIDVAELLGHADVSTLAKIYQHVAQDPSHLLKALNSEAS
jgi:site-specific recombinase XerD